MLLTILIPTYNRCSFLIKNLTLLSSFIRNAQETNNVDIFISDNGSTDDTFQQISGFAKDNKDIRIRIHRHEKNHGIKFNITYVLEGVSGEYFMYLGDDDFIDERYFNESISLITADKSIACIIPSFQCTTLDGQPIRGQGRDLYMKTRRFPPSFRSCYLNSWKGHQMSGLLCRSKGLLEEFRIKCVDNMYPFIFSVAYSSLKGYLIHLTSFPVLVTQPGQERKDWGYGQDGLVPEIFDNYKRLFPYNLFYRSLLEIKLLKAQGSRYQVYLMKDRRAFFNAVYRIITSSRTSIITKIVFPCIAANFFLKRCLQEKASL